jgi:CTP:molybdopterin cytidylyltransferase MocA
VRTDVIERLLAAFEPGGAPILMPRYRDGGGPNPLLIHRRAWPLAFEARADRGLGPVLRDHRDLVAEVAVEGSNPDVDSPADLAVLESAAAEARDEARDKPGH